jgi:branched-chain amino acid transport system ATP-binding protein
MNPPPALAVEGLTKSFAGFQAVDNVSFEVGPGQIAALIGPNGAGKTTTFNLVNGQLAPDRGRIRLEGRDVTGLGPRALWQQGVARTFQITATFASMTVAENVAVALLPVAGTPWRAGPLRTLASPEARRLIADVGLEAAEGRSCGTLAYGDLKRVELAMALANTPRLLLMDEPTAGMAAAEREALMTLAVSVARSRGAAILFTEHDMGVVFRHAERVLVMSRGRIIADGTPAAIRESALVREVYLGRAGAPAAARRGT